MSQAFASIFLTLYMWSSPVIAEQEPETNYQTNKSLAALQKCLTDELSQLGEVVAVKTDQNTTSLVLRDNPDGLMVIDLAPPSVTVTTKFVRGTRKLVQACL